MSQIPSGQLANEHEAFDKSRSVCRLGEAGQHRFLGIGMRHNKYEEIYQLDQNQPLRTVPSTRQLNRSFGDIQLAASGTESSARS
jgi:hypothetical protein